VKPVGPHHFARISGFLKAAKTVSPEAGISLVVVNVFILKFIE
jgi:hypothetical protein